MYLLETVYQSEGRGTNVELKQEGQHYFCPVLSSVVIVTAVLLCLALRAPKKEVLYVRHVTICCNFSYHSSSTNKEILERASTLKRATRLSTYVGVNSVHTDECTVREHHTKNRLFSLLSYLIRNAPYKIANFTLISKM